MSKNHPTDNIYSILGKLDALKPTPAEERFALVKEIRESVEAQGSVLEGVSAVEAKLQKQFNEAGQRRGMHGEPEFVGIPGPAKGTKPSPKAITKGADREYYKVPGFHGEPERTRWRKKVATPTDECTGCAMGECSVHGGIMENDDNDLKILDACAAIYRVQYNGGDEIWDKDWMQDWAHALRQANPTDKELDFIIAKGQMPKRLADVELDVGDDFQFSEGEYMGRPAKYGVCVVGHNGGKPVKTFDTEADAKAYAKKGIRVDGKLLQGSVRTIVGEEAVHVGKYGTEYYGTKDFTGDDEDTPKAEPKVKKGRGRPTKASTGEITSQARMPWGGKPPKDTYKHQKGSFVHKISEGLNFRNIDEETRRSLDELLEELQKDVTQYKATGHCSETLKDFLTVHRHGKAQKLAQEATKVPTPAPAVPSIPGGIGQHNPGQAVKDLRNPFKRTYEETDPLEEELAKLAELAGITQVADEGAGVMHFKKQQAEKVGKDSFTLGDKEFPVDESKVDISEPADKPVNAPNEEYFGMKSGLGPMNPGEADSGEKSMFGGKGDNPMTQQPDRPAKPVRSVKEAFAKMEARLAKEYESIKKISK
jgi:hypothetical protein